MSTKIKLSDGGTYALRGRIATFNAGSEVIPDGVVYIRKGKIDAVSAFTEPAPVGFTSSNTIQTKGTIYPGLIELHNHLSYNIIPLWDVPKQFANRAQWASHADYRKLITGPLNVLGHTDGYIQAIVRYVECRLLFSGVTASQGITLASNAGIVKFYKGLVRNVEQAGDPDLKPAHTKIADITDAGKLKDQLENASCYLLHLAEGNQETANKHFRALQIKNTNEFAITDALAGIHAVGLRPDDFKIMNRYKGNIVWSPMSNLLLYGVTLDIKSAKESGILMGIGSDWTPSGSKNLFEELKVAKLVSEQLGSVFTNEELARMVTSNAAKILKWNHALGSIEVGKKADLLILDSNDSDVYEALINATEKLTMATIIGGIPRFGVYKIMSKFDFNPEKIKLKTLSRYMYLDDTLGENPIAINLSFAQAKAKLKEGMQKLPALTVSFENSGNSGIFAGAVGVRSQTTWHIENEHMDTDEHASRHHIVVDGMDSAGDVFQSAIPLSQLITEPRELDESSVLEDSNHFKRLAVQNNLPEYIKLGLPLFYGQTINLNETIQYRKDLSEPLKNQFNYVTALSDFRNTPGLLTLGDKLNIINQAKIVLSQSYVHLNQKNALYAANPLSQLTVLGQDLTSYEGDNAELYFHQKIINIFNSLRDLHTMYQLPMPFQDKVAFLPFFIEQFYEDGVSRFMVTKPIEKLKLPFEAGVEVTHLNGIPIERAIEINGMRYSGSNVEARFVRGLDSLTFRPMAVMLPPEEDWATIHYIGKNGKQRSTVFPWKVGSMHDLLKEAQKTGDALQKLSLSSGYDYLTDWVHKAKVVFFAPKVAMASLKGARREIAAKDGYITTKYSAHFKVKYYSHENVGYIRIFSFNVQDPADFAHEFKRLLHQLNTSKIIIDIRNNGGGHIWAAEYILQALSINEIEPESAQFINSNLAEAICSAHSPSTTKDLDLDLSNWYETLKQIKNTGTAFTIAYPITPQNNLKQFISDKKYDIVLITDALCYSASDIFAAGFQDHKLGKILGIHKRTGAGGANVWTHSLLHLLTQDSSKYSPFLQPLQYGADIRVAVRRTLRTKKNTGIPLEDLGVVADEIYFMTKEDLLDDNINLIKRACEILSGLTVA